MFGELGSEWTLHKYDEFASSLFRSINLPRDLFGFDRVRHVFNIGQVYATAEKLSLISFDIAGGTIHAKGHHINNLIELIIKLMYEGIQVAIIIQLRYPSNASTNFEGRLAGLLEAFKRHRLPAHIRRLFHVMSGESNYPLRLNSEYRLEFVPNVLWKSPDMLAWGEDEVKELLDNAEQSLKSTAERLHAPIDIVRDPHAVSAVLKDYTTHAVLEEGPWKRWRLWCTLCVS